MRHLIFCVRTSYFNRCGIADGNYMYRIVDNDLYSLLFILDDLFTEYAMPILHAIWKYLRNPTMEERNWLILTEGEARANKIIIEDVEHRREIESEIRKEALGIEDARPAICYGIGRPRR